MTRKATPEQALERFWSQIDKSAECWNWTGRRNNGGYGNFYAGGYSHPHRYSYVIHVGPITKGLQVNHHCDNRLCCNPAHLYLGTKKQNSDDMVRRGRVVNGSRQHNSRITEAEIPFIRLWLRHGYQHVEIADAFGVSHSNIGCIHRGETWKHV